ncbi:MAG TPA: group 1 truncated hemoglobin [Thermoanaerobaculia bacterium]|jgi:hemoglobin
MKTQILSAALGLLVLTGSALAQTATSQAPSLYKRLGGYDAIAAVTDEFIARFAADKSLSRFLVGFSDSSKARLRQLIVDQICFVTGGPCVYIGRDTKTAHKGLGITGADWEASVKLLSDSLDKFKVPQKEKDDFLALVSSLKADTVEKP